MSQNNLIHRDHNLNAIDHGIWDRKVATVVGGEHWSPKAPDHNADSIALFGIAAKLLDHE
jgi:hypothetical protein